jgi:hypothetical protein
MGGKGKPFLNESRASDRRGLGQRKRERRIKPTKQERRRSKIISICQTVSNHRAFSVRLAGTLR